MGTKLPKWTLNGKKWREENGYTTPEWEMYDKHMCNFSIYTYFLGLFVGVVISVVIGVVVV